MLWDDERREMLDVRYWKMLDNVRCYEMLFGSQRPDIWHDGMKCVSVLILQNIAPSCLKNHLIRMYKHFCETWDICLESIVLHYCITCKLMESLSLLERLLFSYTIMSQTDLFLLHNSTLLTILIRVDTSRLGVCWVFTNAERYIFIYR